MHRAILHYNLSIISVGLSLRQLVEPELAKARFMPAARMRLHGYGAYLNNKPPIVHRGKLRRSIDARVFAAPLLLPPACVNRDREKGAMNPRG